MLQTQTPNTVRKLLAKNLSRIQNKRIIKQKDFADLLGISQCFLSEILNCKKNVSMDTLDDMANRLGVEPSTLIESHKKRVSKPA